MVTLRMVAKAAGVSAATVSLALRGEGAVSKKTAEKVRRIAQELGYRPNPLLASLASKAFRQDSLNRGACIAVFHFPNGPGLPAARSPIYSKGLVESLVELGYNPREYCIDADADPEKVAKELHHRMCLGIIVTGNLDREGFGRSFPWESYSIVQCARFHSSQPLHTVRPNIFQAVKMAFDHVRSRGYERIGFAIARHRIAMEDDSARFGAAIAMESDHLSRARRLPIFRGQIGDSEGFLKWIKSARPDAVVAFSPDYWKFLVERGYRIPEDLGFVSLHIWNQEDANCSGLNQNPGAIARESVHLIDQLIRRRDRGFPATPLQILVPSIWNEGSTLR